MKAVLTITDLTRMQGGRVCLAGYCQDGRCMRPVFPLAGIAEEWLRIGRYSVLRPFSIVELDFQHHNPRPPHTEDWVIDPNYRANCGCLLRCQQRELLTSLDDHTVAAIFGTEIQEGPGWYVTSGQGARSLGTISPESVDGLDFALRESGKMEYRLTFTDRDAARYRLAVTDLAFRYFVDYLICEELLAPQAAAARLAGVLQTAQVFLRIGLARGWDKYPDRCYLQVTGVYSFPDYLDGGCFADFASPEAWLTRPPSHDSELEATAPGLDELPF